MLKRLRSLTVARLVLVLVITSLLAIGVNAPLVFGLDSDSVVEAQIGDEVLVVFDHGDVRKPYIIGSLWNGDDAPPELDDSKDDGITGELEDYDRIVIDLQSAGK
ncbi:MAG: phage baseplate assembly protein V [Candidatus Bipolaricaulia bacterium]